MSARSVRGFLSANSTGAAPPPPGSSIQQIDLVERVLEGPVLVYGLPLVLIVGARELVFVEQAELHGDASCSVRRAGVSADTLV